MKKDILMPIVIVVLALALVGASIYGAHLDTKLMECRRECK